MSTLETLYQYSDPFPRTNNFWGPLGYRALETVVDFEMQSDRNVSRNTLEAAQGKVHFIEARDGRRIAAYQHGISDGTPVIYFHGTPGSGVGPQPGLHYTSANVVMYDRPGYGFSDPKPGRHPIDSAEDVEDIANYFGFDTFCGVARSGGGPHLLAAAARLGTRIKRIALLGAPPPRALMQERWFDDLSHGNTAAFGAEDFETLVEGLAKERKSILKNPLNFLVDRLIEGAEDDRTIIGLSKSGPYDPLTQGYGFYRPHLLLTYELGVKLGLAGWVDDIHGQEDWGFSLNDVQQETLLWYGANDTFVTPNQSNCLVENIHAKKKIVVERRGAGHLRALDYDIGTAVLRWCLTGEYYCIVNREKLPMLGIELPGKGNIVSRQYRPERNPQWYLHETS